MIDVLLPYRGDPAMMRTAVRSVLTQTHQDWRLHVLDDADPDPSVSRWLSEHEDPRISFWRSPHQLGVNAAFRHCLELGDAPLVTYMGCDDVMRPDHLAHVGNLAERFPEAAFYQPGVVVIDAAGDPTRALGDRIKEALHPGPGTHILSGEKMARSLMLGNWLYFPSILWRRSALDSHPFRPGLETVLDLDLEMRIVLAGCPVVVDDHVTFEYRRHAASASSSTARSATRFAEEAQVSRDTARACRTHGWSRARRAARFRPTSRANALLHAVGAVRSRDTTSTRSLLRVAASWP